jgi:DNA-binding HxlR family transcriptional regulator
MEKQSTECGVHSTLNILSSKWTVSLIWALCVDPKGFNQLSRELTDVSPRVLSERLKELVEYGLVNKEVFPTNPPTVAYSLTEKAQSLKPIMQNLHEWSEKHALAK